MDDEQVDIEALRRLLADAEAAATRLVELSVEIERLRSRLDLERRRRESAERMADDLRAVLASHLDGEPTTAAAETHDGPAGRRRYVSVRPREAS